MGAFPTYKQARTAGALRRQADWGETLKTNRGTFPCCVTTRDAWKQITTGPYDPQATCTFVMLLTDFNRSDIVSTKQFVSEGNNWTAVRCTQSKVEPEVEITATITK